MQFSVRDGGHGIVLCKLGLLVLSMTRSLVSVTRSLRAVAHVENQRLNRRILSAYFSSVLRRPVLDADLKSWTLIFLLEIGFLFISVFLASNAGTANIFENRF